MPGSKKQHQFTLRLPFELRDYIWGQAEKNRRSVNSEIVHRFEESRKREIEVNKEAMQ